MDAHLDLGVPRVVTGLVTPCINPASYGEICVGCNGCGRFNIETRKTCALKVWREQLKEAEDFDNWSPKREAVQRENKAANIAYCKEKIEELEKDIGGSGSEQQRKETTTP